jgi:hypothetical protein
MLGDYFFIDGSGLTSQIRQLRRADPSFKGRRLCPKLFIIHFQMTLPELGAHEYERATFYFPVGDEAAIEDYLVIPDRRKPAEVRDLYFKFCGQKLKNRPSSTSSLKPRYPTNSRTAATRAKKASILKFVVMP